MAKNLKLKIFICVLCEGEIMILQLQSSISTIVSNTNLDPKTHLLCILWVQNAQDFYILGTILITH